ncbi:class I SAM-dependent methyltransferase [Mycolicibacterium confluentis]|nr:class I SAM-dependent methyltransferase [Mycolicibacterium confluentis]MCV7322416.1 class I SAM-dependent methyltransferase [Mycolicibacterium confluentis]ORV22435.1 SAM-dependent methyltransferase [Mycolicibacterium confluentis]
MTRWQGTDAPRGDDYDARWRSLAASGQNVHGEADLVESLLREYGGSRVLDAGCGTGRVAIELARRGFSTVGVDADPGMLAGAREKAPDLPWLEADLAGLDGHLDELFDLVLLAGNVMIFVAPHTEPTVLRQLSARLMPGGLLLAGFQIKPDRVSLADYDEYAQSAGLQAVARWATWDRAPYEGGAYAVSLHRRTDQAVSAHSSSQAKLRR